MSISWGSNRLLRHDMMLQATEGLIRHLADGARPVPLVHRADWPQRLPSVPQPSVWPRDRHGIYELAHLGEGECALVIDGIPYRLRPGDIALVPPGLAHYETPLAASVAYRLYWIRLEGPSASLFASEYGEDGRFQVVPKVAVRADAELEPLLQLVHDALRRTSPQTDTIARGGLLAFLGVLCRQLLADRPLQPEDVAAPDCDDPLVRAAIQFVLEHYADPLLRVSDLAEHVALSPNYFSVYFRRMTGISPYQFLLHVRLERARALLRSADVPVAEVAAAVGFMSPYHFSRTFKQRFGTSPSEFRLQNGPRRPDLAS